MKTRLLQLSDVVTTAGTQIRASVNHDAVDEYAHAMSDGATFPPIVVFHDGNEYIMADGFHRVMAASRNGFKDIEADVRKGTKSDALKYALGANATHGIKRTNADKRRSVELALAEWPKLSSAEIAKICAVSDMLVGDVRRDNIKNLEVESRVGRDGKTRKLPKKKPPTLTEDEQDKQIIELRRNEPEERPRVVAEPLPKSFTQEATEAFKSLEPKAGDEDPFLDALITAWEEAPKSSRTKFLAYIQ